MFWLRSAIVIIFYFLSGYWLQEPINIFYYVKKKNKEEEKSNHH